MRAPTAELIGAVYNIEVHSVSIGQGEKIAYMSGNDTLHSFMNTNVFMDSVKEYIFDNGYSISTTKLRDDESSDGTWRTKLFPSNVSGEAKLAIFDSNHDKREFSGVFKVAEWLRCKLHDIDYNDV